MHRLALGLALLFGCSSVARADAIHPPPASCPAGTLPTASHSGPHCRFAPPCSAAECTGTCADVGFCVRDVPCGGLRAPDDRPCTDQHVGGPCDALGRCAEDETCVHHAVCAATAAPPPPASTPASTTTPSPAPRTDTAEPSGCSAGAANGAWAWFAAPIALLLFRRRSRA